MKPLPPLMPQSPWSKICLRAVTMLALMAGGAQGQVSVDLRALDAPGTARPTPAARRQPAPTQPAVTAHPEQRAAAQTVHPAARAPATHPATAVNTASQTAQPPGDHPAPPPAATPAAIPSLPTQQPAPPPASTIVPNPATSPLPLPPPVRLVFGAGKTELTPADEAAIQELARAIPAPAADSVNVVAYAAGKPDDPSTARRLSLSRGLAVRSVLLASGVPSAQIYVRALGSTPSNGPADRVELIVAPIGTVAR